MYIIVCCQHDNSVLLYKWFCNPDYYVPVVHLFELGTARSLVHAPPIRHGAGVTEIALNQAGSPGERQLVIVDRNRDMYLTNIRGSTAMKRLCKLG